MSVRPRTLARDVSGASAVEFAMVAPFLIILLFGIFQVGWALHCASSVRYALERSARTLSINPMMTASDVEAGMRARLSRLADPEISVTLTRDSDLPGMLTTSLNATYVHSLSVPMLPVWDLRFQSAAVVVRPAL